MKKRILVGLVAMLVGITAIALVAIQKQPKPSPAIAMARTSEEKLTGIGASALRQAAKEKKYLFLFVYEKEDEKTRISRKTFETVVMKLDARWSAIDKNSAAEEAFVRKYRLTGAPTPFVLAIAPNGAATGGIKDISEARLRKSMLSSGFQECLKALQNQKLVLICLQNRSTKKNMEALRGVNEFKADATYASFTEIVMVDPADPSEKAFLAKLKITDVPQEALTVLLSPPGSIVATFKGSTTKKALAAPLQTSSSCGTGGCGPRGCGPRK
ncbi:MAG TPA: hypothetical protein DD435_08170 [Cyanobacteria bacterium UBA8530]|nr:hypothetical protein [Cyanobacteria bacterium UBA8530]